MGVEGMKSEILTFQGKKTYATVGQGNVIIPRRVEDFG